MNEIRSTAVHEAAHCVVAEFLGFEVTKVEVTPYKNSTKIDYGIHERLIEVLFSTDSQFRIGTLNVKNQKVYISVFERLVILLISGILAEEKVKNPESNSFSLLYNDDERDDISRILRVIDFCNCNDLPIKHNSVEDITKVCYPLITHPKIWKMILKLTVLILQSPNQTMEVSQLNEFFLQNTEEFKIVKSNFSNYISMK